MLLPDVRGVVEFADADGVVSHLSGRIDFPADPAQRAAVRKGERYIAWSTDTRRMEDIFADIDRLLPALDFRVLPVTDSSPDRIKDREAEFRAIWAGCELRNGRIRSVAPITFRPLDDSIRDCVESLLSVAGIEPVRR